MRNLIVGVDGSAESMKAVDLASQIGAATHSKVVLVHVLPMPFPMPPEVIIPPNWVEELTQAGKEILAAARSVCEKAGADCETRILDGAPEEALSRLALQLESDLIAVGSHGRGVVARFLLGSVADRLVQSAGRPVLVAR